jgi:hypothetical protein
VELGWIMRVPFDLLRSIKSGNQGVALTPRI